MLSTQHTTDIISKFETYLDDGSELSTQEELELCNKIYQNINNQREWEWLKAIATGTVSVVNGVYQISPPADFKFFARNHQMTDNTYEIDDNQETKVVYLGTSTNLWVPFKVINFSDRRKYVNAVGYVYYDPSQKKIIFTGAPTQSDLSYEFDYIKKAPDLTTNGSSDPLFPSEYWDIIYHGMAVDDQIIQLFDRAHSYMAENQAKFNNYMGDLAYYNSKFSLN